MSLLGTTRTSQNVVNAILNQAQKDNQVVYGARSVNAQLPKYLNKETKDYDILTKNSKGAADKLASSLNKEYGSEKFKVTPATHKGTYKVKDSEGNTVADYTQTTNKPKSHKILGVKYAELNYQKSKIRQSLRNEANAFRKDKDMDTLRRIREGTKQW